ncbi:MAG: hypothetical protein HY731_03425 [Candidatus Tectomicrobia bacterium]|nr:hypothetical protein [Candidatus Tectomicrobia bacterium]
MRWISFLILACIIHSFLKATSPEYRAKIHRFDRKILLINLVLVTYLVISLILMLIRS